MALGCGLTERDPKGGLGSSGGDAESSSSGGFVNSAGGAVSSGGSAGGVVSSGGSAGGVVISGGSADGSDAGASTGSGDASGELQAQFLIETAGIDHNVPWLGGLIGGVVARGPVPIWVAPMRAVFAAAGCQLMVSDQAVDRCEPKFLNIYSECASYQDAVDAGTVRLSGLTAERLLNATPIVNGSPRYYYGLGGREPSCEEGVPLRAEASDFTMSTPCIAPIDVSDAPVRFRAGEASVLTWEPPQKPGISRLEIRFGLTRELEKTAELRCEAADTGSFELPVSMVDRALTLGVAAFTTVELRRVSVTDPPNAPGLTFRMTSWVERSLDTGR